MRLRGRLSLVLCLVAATLAGSTGAAAGDVAVPNDPYWANQSAYLAAIGLPEAWAVTSGSPEVVVAVVDSGVDLDHPDLAGRLLPGFDAVDGDDHPQDEHGHGTMVAGIIAATADNGIGIAGVLRRGSILPVRVMNGSGNATNDDVAEGIRWAADHGADVISLSIGNYNRSATVDAAVAYALAHDVVVVAAAGNHHDDRPPYPAASDGVLAVAATDAAGRLAGFSNYGDWIDLAAPGIGITTTGLAAGASAEMRVAEGTSMAAPLVAGVAALIRAVDPAASATEIADRLRDSASDRGPHGRDTFYGAGLLDAAAAVRAQAGIAHLDWPSDGSGADSMPDGALHLVSGTPLQGTIAPEGDIDWFAVDVAERSTLAVTVTPPAPVDGRGPVMDPDLTLYDPQLRRFSQQNRTWAGTTETASVHAPRPGRYWVRIANHFGTQSPGTYTVSATATPRGTSFRYVNDNGDSARPAPSGSSAALVDVDSDGRAEILIAEGNRLAVYDPDSNGLPKDEGYSIDLGFVSTPPRLATGDVDGDGDTDVVVATGSRIVQITQSSGRLGARVPIGPAAEDVALSDFDGDNRLDIVYQTSTGVGWLRNGGSAWGTAHAIHAAPLQVMRVADVTGDGRPDIVGLACNCAVTVLRAEPDGSFTATDHPIVDPIPGTSPEGLAVGDVTGDGRPDIVLTMNGQTATSSIGGIHLFEQTPHGTLATARLAVSRTRPTGPVTVTDIDGDGRNDIIVAGRGGAGVFPGRSDGTLGTEIFTGVQSTAAPDPTNGLAVGDANGDGAVDLFMTIGEMILQRGVPTAPGPWVANSVPAENQFGIDPTVTARFRLTRPLDPSSVAAADVAFRSARTGDTIAADLGWEAGTGTLTVTPHRSLGAGPWVVSVGGPLRDVDGLELVEPITVRFTIGPRPPLRTEPAPPPNPGPGPDPGVGTAGVTPRPVGYWMLDAAGTVYHFGNAADHGHTTASAIDLESTPTGKGYWTLNRNGTVSDFGDATRLGNVDLSTLVKDEQPASLSATPTGKGYWVFTNRGRVIAFGDAAHLGDMSGTKLNGPVLASVATPSGNGYYMVASDGGIFAFGDAAFAGSMGGKKLNAPVQSLVPDSDRKGYWLVASDGGIFAFDAPFRGSMGATKLNKPVVGMVRYGDGYLMVGADGGIFTFSSLPFAGSLGDEPPAAPVVAVAALP